jgi:peptidoglycan/LPS O-acetylase OafA/YrhL
MSMTEKDRIAIPVSPDSSHGLTSLRFFAALYVVLYHTVSVMVASAENRPLIGRFLSLGYVSVSFFFFLSGYILSVAYLRPGYDLREKKHFYVARFARIYPLFVLTLLLDTPDWFVAHARNFGSYISALLPTAAVLLEHLLMLQAWVPSQRGIDRPNWSLSVEIFFYLLFPFLAVRIWSLRSARVAISAGALWIGGMLLLLAASNYVSIDTLMFLPVVHLSTFLLGITLARWQYLNGHRIQAWSSGFVTVLVVLAGVGTASLFHWQDTIPKQYLNDGLAAPIFALMILSVSINGRLPARIMGNRYLRELGHASYALYLVHYPIFHLAQRLHLPRTYGNYGMYLATCIGLSILSFRYLEMPLRSRIMTYWLARK